MSLMMSDIRSALAASSDSNAQVVVKKLQAKQGNIRVSYAVS